MSRQFPQGALTTLTPDLQQVLGGLERHLIRQNKLLAQLQSDILNAKETLMAGIQDITAAVREQRTVVDSVVTLLREVRSQLAEAVANDDPVAVQEALDALGANTDALAGVVAENTVAADETPVDPNA